MIKNVSVDTTQTEPLLRVLDTVVIKLEGGTDDDLKILDEKPKEASYPERVFDKKNDDDDVIITSVEKKRDDDPKCVSPRPINRHKKGSDDEENWDDEDSKAKEKSEEKKKKSLKRKRTSSDSSSSSSSDSDSSSSSSSSEDEDDDKVKSKYDLEAVKKDEDEEMKDKTEDKPEETVEDKDKDKDNVEEKTDEIKEAKDTEEEIKKTTEEEVKENGEESSESKEHNGEEDGDNTKKPEDEEKSEESKADTSLEEDVKEKKEAQDDEAKTEEKPKEEEQPETIDLDKVKDGPQPRALHRTSSIFLRNLAPSITKAEIEAVCQKFDGYLRVAIADPLVERRWYRRGWVTFKRDVNIKEICWNLNNTRLRDCEMGAIVNRDLSRRVRPVNGMTAHKTIVRADIKLCAKIAMNLDEKFKLWVSFTNQYFKRRFLFLIIKYNFKAATKYRRK